MKRIAKFCIGMTALSAFSVLTIANLGAYACLKKVGFRKWTKKIKNYGLSGLRCWNKYNT